MKTLTQKPKKKTQRKTSKNKPVQLKCKVSAENAIELENAEQLSTYDSYYKQLSQEVETVERHVRELRQTPGLEHLTEDEAQAQVDFMLRFSAWVFNQHFAEQLIATIDDDDDLLSKSAKVQKPKGKGNKKVTKSLSR
ncbi:hypothetical protein [Pontibacter vulgaris]|uniref:hypothetical protein n=1 Tax=Pontibacter vulgaris TaxID=2905679 RepID=UPI001FA73C8B|nr:hypothetical protein [Pontibacter vulgaris]